MNGETIIVPMTVSAVAEVYPAEVSVLEYVVPMTAEMHLIGGGSSPTVPEYGGDYVVTPTEQPQTLSTKGLRMKDDVVVGAIPTNYGRLTWVGNTLTVE